MKLYKLYISTQKNKVLTATVFNLVLQKLKVAQSCPTLCDPMDFSPPVSSLHGILQARILEWVAVPFSRNLPNPGIEPRSPTLQVESLPSEPPGKLDSSEVTSKITMLVQMIFKESVPSRN